MIPELGNYALSLALALALALAVLPTLGIKLGRYNWVATAKPLALLHFAAIALAFVCLTISFLGDDFSVKLVTNSSNSLLPVVYKISGVWGSHEGSLLLWALILALWTAAVALFSKDMPAEFSAQVLAVLGMVSLGFLAFTLFTSNPFERLFPVPLDGRDLNPLLQDFGLAIHPPMLYMGYVGFSVAFAFSIAGLIGGRLDASWARWMRPWTNLAWSFLTVGIVLGSWWAYYELGWGGWWFWDPVENASFMPWLAGTALMHSLAAMEKRGVFKAWTVLLAVLTFSLSLLGTFLVRSGVLTSVHSFASDPSRGLFILIFLVIVIGGSLTLYAFRAPKIKSAVHFGVFSREAGLLFNNVFLIVATAAILLGTLYPVFLEALGMGKISVGAPFFNLIFIPLTAPLAFLVSIGAYLRWKNDAPLRIKHALVWPFVLSFVASIALPFMAGEIKWLAVFGSFLGSWVILGTVALLLSHIVKLGGFRNGLLKTRTSFYSLFFGHLGLGVFILGLTFTALYSTEKDVRLAPGEQYALADYQFTFDKVVDVKGPNYKASRGFVTVHKNGKQVALLKPEKRVYQFGMPMTEAAIDASFKRDLYVALGEPIDDSEAWAVRLYHKSFIRCLWLGGLLAAFGAFLALFDRRYRTKRTTEGH